MEDKEFKTALDRWITREPEDALYEEDLEEQE